MISENQYQDFYDNAPDLYLSIGENGTIFTANLFGADSIGFSKEVE